jgi:hypothetical protein
MTTRIAAAVLLIALSGTPPVAAQSRAGSDDRSSQLRKGAIKIWTGVALLGAGAFILPITADPDHRARGPALETGLGFAAAGTGLIWWGVQERRQAERARSRTTFRVVAGRTSGVQITRTW